MKRSSFTRVMAVALAVSMMIPSASAAFWDKGGKNNSGSLAGMTSGKGSHWVNIEKIKENKDKNKDKNNNKPENKPGKPEKPEKPEKPGKPGENDNSNSGILDDILGGNDWGNNWGNNWGNDWESILGDWGTGGIFDWINSQNKNDATTNNDAVEDLILIEDETTVEPGTELRASTYALATEEAAAPATFALRSANSGVALAAEPGSQLKYFPVTLFNYNMDTINAATLKADQAAGGGVTTTTTTTTYTTVKANSLKWSDLISTNETKETKYYYLADDGKYYVTTVTRAGTYGNRTYTLTANGKTIASGNSSSGKINVTLYKDPKNTTTSTTTTKNGLYFMKSGDTSSSYAKWNIWTGNLSDTHAIKYTDSNSHYVYMGLVEKEFKNGNIDFAVPEGGIFDVTDTTNKDVYTGVELPFVFKDGYYTFDSNQDSAYFENDATSNTKLKWNDDPQEKSSTTGFFPFDKGTSVTSPDYHFGMVATIPFSMTSNGKMVEDNPSSDDIIFSFSGDDDVWVFIDGKLVLDIGGIHREADGVINFAGNTATVGAPSGSDSGYFTKNGGNPEQKAWTGTLFNEDGKIGILNMDRATFAAQPEHTLTVYYLERGQGDSNCKLKFNLPMKDYVSVQKVIDKSWSEKEQKEYNLTPGEQTMVNKMNYGFTLYKNGKAVPNASYNLYNENNQYMSTPATDANGHFTLKNGQTARFVTEILGTDDYYVVEDQVDGFLAPEFTYEAICAYGAVDVESDEAWTSMTVSGEGSDEAEDKIAFVCENFLKADLPNPYAQVTNDQIVLDYGLGVEIENVLENDVWKGYKVEMTGIGEGTYGTATYTKDGKVTYQLTSPLTGVEVLEYTIKTTGSNGTVATNEYATATGYIYIIPATSMYYEEDFTGLVTYTGNWVTVGNAETDKQETGIVGDPYDSPYGSDVAYLDDNGDSNGSSKYIDTTSASASFSYVFSGTGTTFFARTTGDSGYMRVQVYNNETNKLLKTYYRETSYKDANGNLVDLANNNGAVPADADVLYNIPVFTWNADNDAYGTYKMVVTIGKKTFTTKDPTKLAYGDQFWLDGIRVINPLNPADANAAKAKSAYAADGESNMTVVTLRDRLLKDATAWDEDSFVVFTDTNGAIVSADEYKSNGPKEEVYLNEGQSVTFTLEDWQRGVNKVFLGIKAPMGGGSVKVNTTVLEINNAADCYYEISDYVVIKTVGDTQYGTFTITGDSGLISLTNIKVTGNKSFTIIPGTESAN